MKAKVEVNGIERQLSLLGRASSAREYFKINGFSDSQIEVLIKARKSGIPVNKILLVSHSYISAERMKQLLQIKEVI